MQFTTDQDKRGATSQQESGDSRSDAPPQPDDPTDEQVPEDTGNRLCTRAFICRFTVFGVALVLILVASLIGAVVWLVISNHDSKYGATLEMGDYPRDASRDFDVFVDEFAVTGSLRLTYQFANGTQFSVSLGTSWHQSNTNKQLVHLNDPQQRVLVTDTTGYVMDLDERDQVKACRQNSTLNYFAYIEKLGLTSLPKEPAYTTTTQDGQGVYVYNSSSADGHSATTVFASQRNGALVGWDTFYATTSTDNEVAALVKRSYNYESMLPSTPDDSVFRLPEQCLEQK